MATYYPSLSNPIDFLPAPYSQDQRAAPSTESPHLSNNMMYLNQPSATSYADLFSGSSPSFHDCIQGPSAGARDEVEFFPSTGDHVNLEPTCGQLNSTTGFSVDNSVNEDSQMVSRTSVHIMDGEQNLMCQGLSLSLGTRDIESGVHVPSFQYQYIDPGNLSSHVQAEDGCRSKDSRHAEYFSYNLQGGAPNTTRMWALNSPNCSDVLNEYEPSGLVSAIFRSKYLKAAQLLLDEVVNVQEALKQYEEHKHRNTHDRGFLGSKELDTKMNENSSDPHHSTANCSSELSQSEREDLQNKLTKLSSMLDEVDRRYRQYYHQMQTLVSSFEMVAGRGAAKPYTALALKTISRHFRTLRDAINSQIEVIKKNLGDQDATPAGQGGLPRLRYVDLKLRQQKGFQQFGVMRQSWRPQRGLPENSVSVLRAWLFEHFLHPYPKDSEKTLLARKTGLTRGQVANWFINARVRLWKPMVEEIYKEEFGELDSKTSPEGAAKAATDNFWPPEDSEEELQESATAKAAVGGHMGLFGDLGIQGGSARLGFHNGGYADSSIGCKTTTLKDEYDDQRHNLENHNLSLDSHERSDYHCLDMLNQQERISMWHENCSPAIL